MRQSNRERYIEAMNRIVCSLIGTQGLKRQQALIVCRDMSAHAPSSPGLKRVESLEREAVGASPIPDDIRRALDGNGSLANAVNKVLEKPATKKRVTKCPTLEATPKPSIDPEVEYPTPWIKVTNLEGVLIRYEDANGKKIPEAFWPVGDK